MINRRDFFKASALTLGALGLPLPAKAARPEDLRFLFVFAQGGWDPTRTLATPFSNRNVSMDAGSEKGTVGNISFVDHMDRPSVRGFFESHYEKSLILNGVMVRSIAHEICTMIAMTGTTSGLSPDWPAILAGTGGDFVLPHVVLGGPSFPGDLGELVARTGASGQLEALISGSALAMSDQVTSGPSRPAEAILDRYLSRRAKARAAYGLSPVDSALSGDFATAVEQLQALKDLQYVMDFTGGADLASQAEVAVDTLSLGIARCLTLSSGQGGLSWDTHANNDQDQSTLWEGLFAGLNQLMALLASAPGPGGGTLADQTLVVVLSEMGRTPMLNSFNGKDHWPYTSMLLTGAGIAGNRVIGDFDDGFYGMNIDVSSGDTFEDGTVLSAESVGATLLTLADIDPSEYVSGVDPIEAALL
jgi:hypothetical protein